MTSPNIFSQAMFLEDRSQNISTFRSGRDFICENLVVVSSIHRAMLTLENMSIDGIISAVHLENESAFDLLRAVKSDERWCHIPFILLCIKPSQFTTAVNESLEIAAKVLGADCYLLMEEFDPVELRDQIVTCLANKAKGKGEHAAEASCTTAAEASAANSVLPFKKRQA